jgi:hypothetical protein
MGIVIRILRLIKEAEKVKDDEERKIKVLGTNQLP